MKNYLNFESDIKNLEIELDKLKDPYNQEGLSEVDTKKISNLQSEIDIKLNEVYSNLDPWQTVLVARHEDRPKSKFFIENLFEDFIPLSGDRFYGEDKSVLTGFAKIDGNSVLVIGQEKGEDLQSRIDRNFGMMRPEGYRKTIRLMRLADKFNIPIISFIDTPGAYPGVGAEERGQAEAIAKSIECCMELKVPTLSIVIGEGRIWRCNSISFIKQSINVTKCNLFCNFSGRMRYYFMERSNENLRSCKSNEIVCKKSFRFKNN